MFLPFFGLFYVLKTASFQRFLDITGVAVICGHAAVTLRSRVTATRKFEIVGKWRFLCYEHVTRVLIRVKGVCFCVFSTPCQRYLCRVREVSHSETTIPPHWVLYSTNHEGVPMVVVHGRTSMNYDRCGLSFPFSPPLPGENRPTLMVAGAAMRAARSASNGRRTARFRHA